MSLTAVELADYRAEQTAHLPSTATWLRRTLEPDSIGGQLVSFANAGTVLARRGLASAAEAATHGDVWAGRPRYVVTLPQGHTAAVGDRLILEGVAVEVIGHLSGGSWETARRLAVATVVHPPAIPQTSSHATPLAYPAPTITAEVNP